MSTAPDREPAPRAVRQDQPPATPTWQSPRRTRAAPPWLIPLIAVVVGLTVGVAGTLLATGGEDDATTGEGDDPTTDQESSQVLTTALAACASGTTSGLTLADEGSTLTFDNKGEDDSAGVPYSIIDCILRELDAPVSVITHVEQTTSMDGRQEESWNDITLSWSHHPDRGMDGILTVP